MVNFKKSFFLIALFIINNLYSGINYLDTTFGSGGIVKSSINTFSSIQGLDLDSNGKIVVVGSNGTSGSSSFAIARYTSHGTLDTTFNSSGTIPGVIIGTVPGTVANSVEIDSSNNIYATGTDGSGNIFVVKYNSSGVLDTTFASGGTFSGVFSGYGNSITLDANDKLLVGGTSFQSGQPGLIVFRLNTDGTLDTSFNTTGYNIITDPNGLQYFGTSLKIDSSARIVLGGSGTDSSGVVNFLVARLNGSDGTLDSSFGTNGLSPLLVSTVNSSIQSISIDSSNDIIAAGSEIDALTNNTIFAIAKFSGVDGSVVTSFGPDGTGIVKQAIGTSSQINASVIDQNGNIVVSGFSDELIATARYTSNGSLDTTFGIGGILTTSTGGLTAAVNALDLQDDGKVIVGGYTTTATRSTFTLVRYNKNNTDFINLTSISNNSIINTKIPLIAGTSNGTTSPQASVQVLIDGNNFVTVNTDSSGNWNAGRAPVLSMGQHTIQTNLIINGITIVSNSTVFTVADNLSEDAVFAYNTTNQLAPTAGTLTALSFNQIPLGTSTSTTVGTWNYSGSVFTCNKAGRYVVEYNGYAGTTGGLNILLTDANVCMAAKINGTEYLGSQGNTNVDLVTATSTWTRNIAKQFIIDFSVGDTLTLNYAVNISGISVTTGLGLVVNTGSTGTPNSYSLSITRIG